MKPLALVRTLRRRLARLARDQRGVTAVEFAILLPFMLTLYLGGVEVSQGVAMDRKTTMVVRAVADLAAQTSSINNTDMTNILNASAAVVAPYSASSLKVTVSSVSIDSQSKAKIVWSDAYNTTARTVGQQVTLPAALLVANTTLIWGEVQYAYTPTIGYVLTGTLNLSDQIYMRPRLTTCVTRVNSNGTFC
jgi:Flp pilus assembly protein TadG